MLDIHTLQGRPNQSARTLFHHPHTTSFSFPSSLPFSLIAYPFSIHPPLTSYTITMLRLIPRSTATRASARLFSTSLRSCYPNVPSPISVEDAEKDARVAEVLASQAPNRKDTWAPSQKPRAQALTGVRVVQRDIEFQPRPYAGIELVAKQPIEYLHGHDNIAVCDGGRGVQGHPKVFINLDKPGAHPCTYCGTRYALDKYKEGIESGEFSNNVKS